MSSSKFSIVIPTRNRAGLLRHALATAVGQTHDDVEILVSDNCSSDETSGVVAASDDPRIRYVRSDVPLTNAESWEFAVSHATGEWITVLGDDDGFVSSLVDRVLPVLDRDAPDLLVWNPAWYVHPDTDPPWPVVAERNVLSIHPFGGATTEVDARDQLRRMFQRREADPLPSVVNGFARRALLERVRAKAGRVFGEPDPSWAFAAAAMVCVDKYLVLDLPLTVAGVSPVNIGGAFLRNTREHAVIEEFDQSALFRHAPLQVRTCVNLVAESLLRQKEVLGDDLVEFELDLVRYLVGNRVELTDAARASDGGAALDEWRRVLRCQPPAVRANVRRDLLRHRVRSVARAVGARVPGGRAVRAAMRRDVSAFRLVAGSDHGFSDLPGATDYLARWVLPVGTQEFVRASPTASRRGGG